MFKCINFYNLTDARLSFELMHTLNNSWCDSECAGVLVSVL